MGVVCREDELGMVRIGVIRMEEVDDGAGDQQMEPRVQFIDD